MARPLSWLAGVALLAAAPLAAQQTVPERTAGERTSSHAEVLAFLDSLANHGAAIRVGTLGESPQGRRIPYVVAARPMVADPAEAKRSGKPVFYIQGNIHAGEVEGKEAVQRLLRDMTLGPLTKLLDSVIVVWVPIYNSDGNDAFGPGDRNRGGQNGPAIVGLRANGQGLDLNRDYVKQEAPETRGSLALVAAWDPDVWMDLHTTNGSYHGYALTWAPGLNPNQTPANIWLQDKALPEIRKRMRDRHKFETFPYGNFRNQHPDSLVLGWDTYESYARYGSNLMGMSRISILSEAYSNDPLLKRIDATYAFMIESLRYMAEKQADLRRVMAATIAARPDSVAVRSAFAPPRMDTVIAELTKQGEGNGGFSRRQRTGEMKKVFMPVVDRFVATRREAIPAAYVLDAQWTEVVALLRRQGIVVEKLTQPWVGQSARFQVDSAVVAARPFEGHRAMKVDGKWVAPAADSLPAGSYIIPTNQRFGMLAAFLLEPASEDGYTTWNSFDRAVRARASHPVRRLAALPSVPRALVP
ncbi:MAG: hypothetical protein IPO52_06145 [Gemmatimonadetes bacterium]|nr:hypothetical protein [Gemmatimonadota bacterium]MBK9548680.1 hypothetical protein [Gemmatimonadota bacterium]MBP6571881.1 hypothetical protein [Gemmatimonadales bacterium]MBP7620795.1 hypothetical protein [Gemmatimonadales bacterium]MBP9898258.1 hypothetical protein [Gemmatimonadales bacterium]